METGAIAFHTHTTNTVSTRTAFFIHCSLPEGKFTGLLQDCYRIVTGLLQIEDWEDGIAMYQRLVCRGGGGSMPLYLARPQAGMIKQENPLGGSRRLACSWDSAGGPIVGSRRI